jgi:transitional endoplasmic reticulum ATPase
MDESALLALEQALELSPNNHLLRRQVANGYYALAQYEKAKTHLQFLMEHENQRDDKLLLARCMRAMGETSVGIVICEDLLDEKEDAETVTLYIELLIQAGQTGEAVAQYQSFQSQKPGWRDEKLEKSLKITQYVDEHHEDQSESEAAHFLEKPDLTFDEVGGMDAIKEEIRMKIIHPLNNPELYKAFGKKTGGGILLFGPPGCGKTYIAKATAGQINARFISIGLEDIMDMWIGNSEKNLHAKFELARQNTPCVLFFDEIDALGSKRNDLKQSAGRNLINQFLRELDGLENDNEGILILGATNSLWHMDSAFLRPGRFDRVIFVPPPDEPAKAKILELKTKDKPVEPLNFEKLAKKMGQFSGADIQAVVDQAVEAKLSDSMRSGKLELIREKDMASAIKKVRPSTKEWFATARNYAMYSNQSGLYDEILKYI